MKIGSKPKIRRFPLPAPYTTNAPHSPYGHGRSNGWSFLTNTNLRPWTVSRNYTNSECFGNFGPFFSEIAPRARFWGIPNSPTPKSHKHSRITGFSDTVQGLRLVSVRNDQPFDLPYPYGEYRGSGVYGGYGYMAKMGCLGHIFRGIYLLQIVPILRHLSSVLVRRFDELPNLKI